MKRVIQKVACIIEIGIPRNMKRLSLNAVKAVGSSEEEDETYRHGAKTTKMGRQGYTLGTVWNGEKIRSFGKSGPFREIIV